MESGWIKLYREILKKAIWTESTSKQKVILITLLTMANHDEKQWEWQGKKYVAKPGQFVTSLKSIAKNAGDDISIQNVRTALLRFEKYEFLTNKSTNRNRLITIVNWELYQEKDKNQQANRQAANKQLTTNKNDKECKKKDILSEVDDLKENFTSETKGLIDPYWDVIKRTRKNNQVQPSVVLKTMQAWLKFDDVVVKYALKKHIQAYDDGEHTEKYTLGIMRGTTPEKAIESMNVVEFKSRSEPTRRAIELINSTGKFGDD